MFFSRAGLTLALVVTLSMLSAEPSNATTVNSLTGYPRQASDQTWDRVAGCESGHHWDDTRGGYQGGLHFDPWSWDREVWWLRKEGHNVTHIARDANLAPRRIQIDMADDWLRRTSWKQSWPVCGARGRRG